jgi:NAD(P)-dependent dehydrogenase (short-subunit alcohol dehydrogenase family)
MIDLTGKCLLVTGGSRGIGAAIVRAAASAGASVLLHYGSSREAAERVREEAGSDRCRLVRADLAKPRSGSKLWEEASSLGQQIDVLVNNAGIFEPAPVDSSLEAWEETWDRVLQVNLRAPADLCRAAINDFRRQGGGKIINIASRAAFRGEAPDQMPYGATKGALVTLTKTIARGYAKEGILAFAIAPGFTETEMVSDHLDEDAVRNIVADIPLGEMAPPSEVGALVAFLASDHARHLTGATFDINGASYVR